MDKFFYSQHLPKHDPMIVSVNVLKRERPMNESIYFAYNHSLLVLDYGQSIIHYPKVGEISCPNIHLKSPRSFPFWLSMKAGGSYIAISLKPTAFHAITGKDAKENMDVFCDLEKKKPNQNLRALHQQCLGIYDAEEAYKIIEKFCREECSDWNQPTPIDLVVHEILDKKGMLTLDEILEKYPFSLSTLNRYFKKFIGMTAGLYCRLTKFSSLIQDLSRKDVQLRDIAYEYGYTDQSHFIRDFKQFASITPKQYLGPDYQSFIQAFGR